jgi:hypothetical protein
VKKPGAVPGFTIIANGDVNVCSWGTLKNEQEDKLVGLGRDYR